MWRVPSGHRSTRRYRSEPRVGFAEGTSIYASAQRRDNMETSPAPWIDALRRSHDRLRASVEPLDLGQLEQRSYASEWSIAQVVSHLGSQAEIFGLFLDAGLT